MFLESVSIHPFDDGRAIGQLLAVTGTADVVDAHLVMTAFRLDDDILTGDPYDLNQLADTLGVTKPAIQPWP